MANYGERYWGGWQSMSKKGYLYISQIDYVGTSDKIKIIGNGLSINYVFGDWNDPLVKLQAEFSIVNDREDFFELLPLLSAEEREYKITIIAIGDVTDTTLFEGFINCDTTSQKYLHKQIIRFAASGYLNKLEDNHPPSIDILQNMTFINVINEILNSTGAGFPIFINSKLHAEGDVLEVGQTLFNKNGFYTEVFWTDNVDRVSSAQILKDILISFDCYIYWWNGGWFIDRYEDIWWEGYVDYVMYLPNSLYGPDDIGEVISIAVIPTKDISEFVFTDQSQTIYHLPGLKTIQINLQDERLSNLVLSDFSNIENIPITGATNTLPEYRQWLRYEDDHMAWFDFGKPKGVIKNSIHRLLGSYPPPYLEKAKGLYTSFKSTVGSDDDQLNIKFKYVVSTLVSNFGYQPTGGYAPPAYTGKLEDYSFHFSWFLKNTSGQFIMQLNDVWKMIPGDETAQMQYVVVEGSSFDAKTNSCEVNITIPLGLVDTYQAGIYSGKLRGEISFVLGIGAEHLEDANSIMIEPLNAWYGDFEITTTGGLQDNVITGTINTKFLNKKEIPLTLYDMENYNYKNGILRNGPDGLVIRTERWGVSGGESQIAERGVVYSQSTMPTVADDKILSGTGFGSYSSIMQAVPGTTYFVRAYAIDGDGTVYYGQEETFTTDSLNIGSYHQGGIIGYLYQPGDPGYDPDLTHGIIVSMQDVSADSFWCSLTNGGPYSVSAYDRELRNIALGTGGGQANTDKMEANNYINNYAVKAVLNYAYDGYTDWVMPDAMELWRIRPNKVKIGGFAAGWYWSSSEVDTGMGNVSFDGHIGIFNTGSVTSNTEWKFAWAVNFANTGNPDYYRKNNHMRVRAIRYF